MPVRIRSQLLIPRLLRLAMLMVALALPRVAAAQSAPATEEGHDLRKLPVHIVVDFAHLVKRTPLITLAAGGALAVAAHPGDVRIVHDWSSRHGLEESLDAGAGTGSGFAQIGGAAAVYAIGAAMHRTPMTNAGAELIEAQLLSGVLTQGLKVTVGRRRPDGGRHSFPSGHASATFATAGVLAHRYGWRVALPSYIGAAYVAASRIADRQHYASDVIFGAALGLASSQAVASRIHYRHVAIALAPTLRGVGITGVYRP